MKRRVVYSVLKVWLYFLFVLSGECGPIHPNSIRHGLVMADMVAKLYFIAKPIITDQQAVREYIFPDYIVKEYFQIIENQ